MTSRIFKFENKLGDNKITIMAVFIKNPNFTFRKDSVALHLNPKKTPVQKFHMCNSDTLPSWSLRFLCVHFLNPVQNTL